MLVIPVMTYGCHIFAHTLGNETIKSQLQQLNRLAALSLGSVPRSSPTLSLEVLYNLKPLELVMENIALRTHMRLTQGPNRAQLWEGTSKNIRKGHLKHWNTKLEQYNINTTIDKDKITQVKVWNKNFNTPDFETTRNDAHDTFEQFVCYTDGSKLKNQTGFGFVIKKYNRTIYDGHGNMGPAATVFQAEIKAITMACKTLYQRKNMDITIRTDSQAAITAIRAINITSNTVLDCKNWLNKLGGKNRVTLAWIKAHAGHPGNDQADAQAKAGTTQDPGPGPWPNEPASYSNRNLLEKNMEQWQQKWVAKPDKYKHSKKFIQNVSQNVTKLNKLLKNNTDRQLVGILVQCITGHCGLRYQEKKSNPLIDSVCRYCRKDVETPIHLIKNCEALTLKRLEIFRAETLPDDFDWSPDQVMDFIKSTGVWTMMERQPTYI
jgi:ribonuclease HI